MSDVTQSLTTFIDTINKAMPGAWDASVRQVYIYGALYAVAAVICAIVLLFCLNHISSEENPSEAVFLTGIATLICGILLLIMAILYLTNPTYWAIQLIMP